MKRLITHTKRTFIAIVGSIVVLLGVIMVPYPGPGWLVIFAGLAILSTEFNSARRILSYARVRYDAWATWLSRQAWFIKGGVGMLTCVVVVATIWLANGYGVVDSWFSLGYDWIHSPLLHKA